MLTLVLHLGIDPDLAQATGWAMTSDPSLAFYAFNDMMMSGRRLIEC